MPMQYIALLIVKNENSIGKINFAWDPVGARWNRLTEAVPTGARRLGFGNKKNLCTPVNPFFTM